MAVSAAKQKAKEELLSIAKIAFRCNLDKTTTKKRLDLLGYEPESERAKLKLYRFNSDMFARLTAKNDELGNVRIRKETAAAEKIELQISKARGELASVAEFSDVTQRLFGGWYKAQIRMIKRWAPRVAKMATAGEIEKFMLSEYQRQANNLRDDFSKYLATNGNGNGKK